MNIHLFIGLPGSGKTHMAKLLLADLEKNKTPSLLVDDLFVQLRDNSFNWQKVLHLPLEHCSQIDNHSKNNSQKIEDYIITDFLPCTQEQQSFLFNKLSSLLPQHQQIWHFFDNDYQQCFDNILQRPEHNNVLVTLELMHKQYAISDFIKENTQCHFHPVYNSQSHTAKFGKKF